jgi:integrase
MYHDEKTPGLVLRVYPSGVKSFFLYRWTESKPEYVFIGRYPAVFPEQARKRAAELNSEIVAGKNPAEQKRRIRAEMKLGELFERFLVLHARKHKRPNSVAYDESLYRLYLSDWKSRRISSISRRDVRELLNRIGEENGPYQANRTRSLLHTIYEKALEWGYTGTNPCFKMKKFPEQSRERFIQKEEFPGFFAALQSMPELERDFFTLLLFTGARKSNVLSLAWEDLNLDLRLWNIPAEQSKNKTAYTVPLVEPVVEILQHRKKVNENSPWVFPSASITGHLHEPKHAWTRLLKRAELEKLRMHDLRRTLASWMAITGASEYVIKGALGHKTAGQSVTNIYARLSIDPIRKAMETAVRTMLRKGEVIPDEENILEFKASV